MSKLPVVKFSDVDEFCRELAKDTPDRHIVRVTSRLKTASFSPNVRHVLVVATCAVTRPGDEHAEIVRLEEYVGDVWGIGQADEITLEKAEEAKTRLESKCRQMDMDVRGGMVE